MTLSVAQAIQRRTLERLVGISKRWMGMVRKGAGVYQRLQDFSQGGAHYLYAKWLVSAGQASNTAVV